jgi:peptidoglycan hydrolase-like protein with peptidoglycan-binding domain
MNRLLALGLACICAVFTLAPATVLAADVALVIGNRDYRKAPDALSAEIDARRIADALADGGYDVSLGLDANRREMRSMLAQFSRKAASADKVVIYYSGHALRSGGDTYLAPVDQENDSLVDVMMDGVPLDLVMRIAAGSTGRAVVFIDAAQLRGYTPNAHSEPGLAFIDPGEGVLVISAAAPGRAVRRDHDRGSAFAEDVMREFLVPRARAMQAARNMPAPAWATGAVQPGLRLIGRTGAGGQIGSGQSPEDIESALRLTRDQRREVQESLSLLGHDPRGIDGLFGAGTRTAIRLWQRANSRAETGYLDAEQLTLLRQQAQEASRPGRDPDSDYWARSGALGTANGYRDYLARYSEGAHATEARDALKRIARAGRDIAAVREQDDWRAAASRDLPQDYSDYLARYPTGIWKPEAEARLAELNAVPATPDYAAEEEALGLTRNDRLSVEQRLNFLGFSPGTQDGFFDENTRWAIEGYQRSRGFEATGYLTQPVISRLVNETGGTTQGIVIDGAEVLRRILGGN